VIAHVAAFWEALADDLASPRAVAALWDALRDDDLGPAERWALLADVDRALGLGLAAAADPDVVAEATGTDERIDALLAERQVARAERNFVRADEIRDELVAENVIVTDTADGATWRRSAG